MNQDQGQQSDEERLGQLMAMLNLMRNDQQQISREFEPSSDSSPSKEAWTEKADVEEVENLPVKTEVTIKQEPKDQNIQTTEDEVQVIGTDEITDTQTRIETAIEEIEMQLKMVLQSEGMIQNEEERQYYEVVVGKLKEQLEELKNIQRDLQLYKDVIDGAQFEKEMALQEMNEHATAGREEIGLAPAELEEAFEDQFKYEEEMERLNSKQKELEEEAQHMVPRSVVIKNAKKQQYFCFT
jgi:chromosome segregation ATPase